VDAGETNALLKEAMRRHMLDVEKRVLKTLGTAEGNSRRREGSG
jgi:hypothetical protein